MTKNIVLLIVLALLGAPTSGTAQQPANPAPTAEQQSLLKESDALWNKALQLEKENKLPEAIAAADKSLGLLRQVRDELHRDVLGSWIVLSRLHGKREDFRAQQRALAQVLHIQERLLGKDHWEVTDARLELERSKRLAAMAEGQRRKWIETSAWIQTRNELYQRGKYNDGIVLAREIVAACRNIWGEAHEVTGRALAQLGSLLSAQDQDAEAEQSHRAALAIFLKVQGEEHPETALSYANLATDLGAQGQYAEAAKMGRKALAIYRKVRGEEHSQTAASYHSLAYYLGEQQQYAEAEQLNRKALAIRRKVLGEEHLDTARSYNNLAYNLNAQGQYAEAEQLDRNALAIRRKVLGEEHANTATSYNNLATDLSDQGQSAEAEKLHRKALAIRLKVRGEEHPEIASSYNNLALALYDQGQYAEAEKLHRKALAITVKLRGPDHADAALRYNNLAVDLHALGQYAEAEQLDRKALAIYRKVRGVEHFQTALSYNNLARDLRAQGRDAEAEKLHRTALAIFLKVRGEEHPQTALSYNNLAYALRAMSQYGEAETLDRKALAIRRKLHGEDHPDTAASYYNLTICIYEQGDYEKATAMALAGANSFYAARLSVNFTGLGRAAFAAQRSPMNLLACLLAHSGKHVQAWEALETNLGRGLFDDLTARTTRTLKDRQREDVLLSQLANIDKRMPNLLGGKTKNPEEADMLRKQRDALMVELTEFQGEMVKKYGVLAGEVYRLERIRKSLAADAAFVAWFDIAGRPDSKNPAGDHWAIVVRNQGAPICVPLTGSGRDGVWSEQDDELPDTVRGILHNPDLAHQDALAKLGRQRLGALQKHLQGVNHLIVLNSPWMAGIPIETLTDAYRISYAPSATMFTWLQEKRDPLAEGNKLLALGDAVFSPEQAKKAAAVAQLARGSEKFSALPGTRFEVEQLAGLTKKHGGQATPLLGVQATRVNLERLAEKNQLADFRYIHLATHAKADPKGGLNSFLVLSSENPDETNYATLSAGQILRTWKLNADLVTLSACETALGKHEGGEGYVGFSQALLLAGARTLVLSQWRVSDHASAALMLRFYQNLLGERPGLQQPLSKIEALEEARRWLRELPRADALKLFADMPEDFRSKLPAGARPFEHPNFWAAFILVGDPGLARKP